MNIYTLIRLKKAILYLPLLFLIALLHTSMNISAQWTGNGTSANPYLINNVADLTTLAINVNNGTSTYSGRFFRLTASLNLTGTWTPIGTSARTFQGNLDGNNHIISGVNINLPTTDNVGLFGFLTNATIRNLGVEANSGTVTGHNNVGILAGSQSGGSITNCYAAGNVMGNDIIGGLIGNMAASTSNISGCYVFVQASGSTNTNGIGGLAGVQRGNITNCYTFGSIQGNGPAGGIAGTGSTSAILSNSYSKCSISSNTTARIGGLTGNQSQSTAVLKNSVAVNDLVSCVLSSNAVGRVLGFRNNSGSAINNYAWDNMPITVNGLPKSVNPNGNDIDGASQTLSNLKSYPFYYTTASWENAISTGNNSSAIWNIWDDNSYPYLQTQSSPVNNIGFSETTLQGIFRSDVIMDSILIYLKNGASFTRLGAANVNNTNHTWTYSDPALNVNGIVYIFTYETGKAWPSYPITETVCSLPPTFDTTDISSCISAVNLLNAITNLQNATINDVRFSKADGDAFDANIILSPATYSVYGTQTIYARATNSLGCQGDIESFQIKQTGSLLFKENFGSAGTSTCSTVPLGSNITSYTFGGNLFTNGNYSICSQLSSFYSDYWYWGTASYDHTEPGKGYSMIVNADFEPGKFYTLKINNLCPGTHLYFSAWVFNLVDPNAPNTIFYTNQGVVFNDPDLLFVLTDDNGTTLAQHNTGSIPKVTNASVNWRPYSFEFVTGASPSVTLTLYNNAPGGNGNDLMIDDIEVYLCVPPVVIDGKLSYCPGEVANLNVKNEDGSPIDPNLKVNWLFSTTGDLGPDAQWTPISEQTAAQLSSVIQQAGYIRAVVGSVSAIDAGLYNCCSNSNPIRVVLTPELMYWKKNATDNNWNNPANWTDANGIDLNAVPGPCTDVHIPGNADYYPSLDSISTERTGIYRDPVCRDITFHFGAEVAKQHFLDYRKAYVLYNFGYYDASNAFRNDGDPYSAAPINRGRWYALAAPLKNIVSGDFSVGGFPNMWQQGFKSSPDHTSTLSGDWYTPENTVALEIGARQNYAISVWAGEYLPGVLGEDDHKNLNDLKGILQMPYFEDPVISPKHRIHTYVPADSASRFNYYYYQIPGLPIEPSKYDDFKRGSKSYRFVFEDDMNKPMDDFAVTVPAGTEIMIGNPFISSLDFQDFYDHNSPVIENYYRLFINNNFDTYSLETGSATGLTNYIGSFQGFFVTTKGTGSTNLHFPVSSSVTRPGYTNHEFRTSDNTIYDVLRINVESKVGKSHATLVLNPLKKGSDVQQLFIINEDSKNVPQLYMRNSANLKNVIQYESGNLIEVPVGIIIESSDSITLSVSFSEENHFISVTLADKWLNKEVNLLENTAYSFRNEPGTGERFLLRINSGIPTDIHPVEEKNSFNAFIKNRVLEVYASSTISDIEVLTMQGISILFLTNLNTSQYTQPVNIPQGIYIIKITLKNNEIKTQKTIFYD